MMCPNCKETPTFKMYKRQGTDTYIYAFQCKCRGVETGSDSYLVKNDINVEGVKLFLTEKYEEHLKKTTSLRIG